MTLKNCFIYMILAALASCSTMQEKEVMTTERYPAEVAPTDCQEIANSLITATTSNEKLQKALVDRKLISFTNKFVTVQHPRLDWINRTRISLNKSIKNWNNNKHPAFYIFSDEDVVTQAKTYFQTVNSMVTPDIAVAPEATKNLETINSWMKAFESYQTDVDKLLEERISLQYNLSMLKKLKLKEDVQDIKFTIKRDGKFVEEVVTLRKSDKDLDFQKKKLKAQIAELDGTSLKNGKIKERIIRQAMLSDMLTILQREFEYGLKNTEVPNPELVKELNHINELIKKTEFQPTTYGVYRITNKVFVREVIALSKLDVAYKKFVGSPVEKLKEIVSAFIQNRAVNGVNPTAAEKIGIFKKIYTKITSITPTQAVTGAGVAGLTGLGLERYFTIRSETTTTLADDRPHQEQIDRTTEEEVEKSEAHTEVIEVHINELTE